MLFAVFLLIFCFFYAFLVNIQSDSRGLFFFAFLFVFFCFLVCFFLLFFKRPCDRDFRIAFLITFSALFSAFPYFLQRPEPTNHKNTVDDINPALLITRNIPSFP